MHSFLYFTFNSAEADFSLFIFISSVDLFFIFIFVVGCWLVRHNVLLGAAICGNLFANVHMLDCADSIALLFRFVSHANVGFVTCLLFFALFCFIFR